MKSTEYLKELRGLSKEELIKKRSEAEEEMSNLGFQAATTPLTNPTKVRTLRRDIARINTVLNEK